MRGLKIIRYLFRSGGNPAVFLELTRHDIEPWDRYDKAGTLVSAWRTYLHEVEIQRDVLFLFRIISQIEGSMTMFLFVSDVVPTIVNTMKTHFEDHACTSELVTLIANVAIEPSFVEAMVAQGVLDFMFKMLARWTTDGHIIMTVFIVMQRFVAADGKNRGLILNAGAAQIIQNIVNEFSEEPLVQQRGMEAIAMLFENVVA